MISHPGHEASVGADYDLSQNTLNIMNGDDTAVGADLSANANPTMYPGYFVNRHYRPTGLDFLYPGSFVKIHYRPKCISSPQAHSRIEHNIQQVSQEVCTQHSQGNHQEDTL